MENVFEPSFGNRPQRIVGRDAVLAQVERSLGSRRGSRDRAMFIVGQRGMGKTALLLEIESRAQGAGFVTARSIANERMLDTLLERLQINGRQYVEKGKRKVKGLSAGAFGFSFGLTFSDEIRDNYGFQTKLSLLCDRLEECGLGVLLLVDEVRATSKEMRELADAYQQLVGDGKNIAICMAGLNEAISEVLNDKVLTFLNRAVKVQLNALELPPVREYYAEVFSDAGMSFAPGELDRAVRATGGFPYLLQLIGYYLMELGAAGRPIDGVLLSQALSSAREDLESNVFAPTLAALSRKDIAFLRALASSTVANGGVGLISDVIDALDVDNGYAQVYRRRLLDSGVISAPRDGELVFTVPFLAEYLNDGMAS